MKKSDELRRVILRPEVTVSVYDGTIVAMRSQPCSPTIRTRDYSRHERKGPLRAALLNREGKTASKLLKLWQKSTAQLVVPKKNRNIIARVFRTLPMGKSY